jgi:hypothetical protein
MSMAAMMYFSSWAVVIPVNTTDDMITPAKIATPPRFGVGWVWEVRPLGRAVKFFSLEILTIGGMEKKVTAKEKMTDVIIRI